MDKEEAIKILKTNIHRRLCRNWLLSQIPIIVVVAIFVYIDSAGISLKLPGLVLPPSQVTITSVLPAVFSGTVTASSILIGFFSVSAYTFRSDLEKIIDSLIDDLPKIRRVLRELLEKQKEVSKKSSQMNPKELKEAQKLLEQEIKECNDLKEDTTLFKDAFAHQQEHLNSFMITFWVCHSISCCFKLESSY